MFWCWSAIAVKRFSNFRAKRSLFALHIAIQLILGSASSLETFLASFNPFLEHGTVTELRDLFNELNIMASVGSHPNVVSLIGACSEGGKFELFGKLEDFYFLPPHLSHLARLCTLSCACAKGPSLTLVLNSLKAFVDSTDKIEVRLITGVEEHL